MGRRTAPLSLFVLTLGGAVAIGCSGSSHSGGSITPNQPITMTIVPATGVPADGQTPALVNLSVHDPATGNPITSAVLTLTATGSGNIITQPAPTDQNGNTQGKIASTVAETKTVTARGQTISAIATASVSFVQAATSTANEMLVLVSGDNQSAPRAGVLANPLIVKVTDLSGNPVPGVPVLFTVTSGGGVLSITNTSTNQNGIAETTMRVGQAGGDNTVTVVVKDESGNQIQGSPFVFHETAQ